MSSKSLTACGPYRTTQLPDFSDNRRSHHSIHTLFHQIALNEYLRVHVDNRTLDSLILIACAYVLGMYCGTTDVLLSLSGLDGTASPFRLQWDETMSWQAALEVASTALKQIGQEPADFSQSLEALGLVEDQSPFIAAFRDSSRAHNDGSFTSSADPSRHLPLLIHLGDGTLHLLSLSNQFCSSMASMFLRQIAAVIAIVFTNPAQKIATPLHLDNNLTSVVEALPEHERATYYSHIHLARFATDYILPHSTSKPDAIAVQWYPDLAPDAAELRTPECLSYADLDRAANRLARFLLGRGLCREDRVAVCMDRNLVFHSVLFGILRAGGCYVPIDPELPVERKLFIARDSSARFTITSSESQARCPFGDLSIDIHDIAIQETISGMSDAKINLALPESVAYMLYTSGTTGNPKGCLITHNGLSEAVVALSSFAADVEMADIRKGRYLAVASIAFDVHLAEVFIPLALGMTLVSAKRGQLLESLPTYISLLGITHVGLVPSLIDATMCVLEEDQKTEEMKLRFIASGGEKITDSILDKWGDHPVIRLTNFYGPSEVTIGCCARLMDGSVPRENIGRTFASVSSYVVDENLNILPRGVVGELVVAGPLVGRGYYRLPDLTAKCFMEWPRRGTWSYRTGDLVRMLPDGTLHIVGRVDSQVKLRGVRIEVEGISAVFRNTALSGLGFQLNVETILATHPSIGNGATPQLVTFVAWNIQAPMSVRRTTRPSTLSSQDSVIHFLRTVSERELASYMRPTHIIRLSWLPLSPNGKTDSKALSLLFKDIDLHQLIGTIDVTPAENGVLPADIQRKVVSLVENHIKISPVDSSTSLFAYGMDSLSMIRLVSDIRRMFHVSIAVMDIMKASTIKAVVELIQTHPLQVPASSSVVRSFSEQWLHTVKEGSPHLTVGYVLPPFPIQEGVLHHSDAYQTACVQHVIMKISYHTPLSQVRNAWAATMEKLDILRTVFYFGKQLIQVVLPPSGSQLPWSEKWTRFTDVESFCTFFDAEAASSVAKQINNTTSTAPLFRLTVFSPSDKHHGHWLILSIHHALFDGVSLPFILKFAEDELLARPHPTACAPELLLEYMHSANQDAGYQFWTTMFSNFSWSEHRSVISTRSSSQIRRKVVSLTTSLTDLKKLLAPRQVTMQSALTCTFAISLAKYIHHTDDIAFVVIRAGRLLPVDGAEHAIYPTINALPIRVHLGTKGCLQRVQADISASVPFEHLPLSHVQKWLPPGTAPFDTVFVVTVKDDTQYETWDIVRSELPEPDFPLAVEIMVDRSNDVLIIQAAYQDCEYLATGVDGILRQFEAILLDTLNSNDDDYVTPPTQLGEARHMHPAPLVAQAYDDGEELEKSSDVHDLAQLRVIVSKFFGVSPERLYPSTSLISLGLDSIQSVGLSRILRQHGYFLRAADIMGNPILWKLGALCTRSSSSSAQAEIEHSVPPLQKQIERIKANFNSSACKLSIDDEVEIFPTTALQTGMISQTVASAGKLYFHSFVLDLDSNTDLIQLRNAWVHAVHDLDILRTTFHYVTELASWVQARHSVVELDWQECIPEPLALLQVTINKLSSHLMPTDESAFLTPPMHLRVVRTDPVGVHIVLFLHHALYDGLSIPGLLSHVEHIYHNRAVARPAQFFDFIPRVLSQQEHATTYWTGRLRDYHPAAIPRNSSLSSKAITTSMQIFVHRKALTQLVHDNAVTLQCLAQATWAKYLASLHSSNDVVYGHVVSGRSFDGSESVVGPMLNTIPCRVQFTPHMSNRELLQSIHRANVSGLPWQHVSLRAVQHELQSHDLLGSLFLFQPWRPLPHSNLWTLRDPEKFDPQIQYPLNIEFHEVEAGFVVKLACRSDIIDAGALSGVLANIETLMIETMYHLDSPAAFAKATNSNIPLAHVARPVEKLADVMPIPPELLAALVSVTRCPADKLFPSQSLGAIGLDSITAISLSARCRKSGLAISVADVISSFTIEELARKVVRSESDNVLLQNYESPSLETEEYRAIVRRFPERCRRRIVSVSAATEGMKWLVAAWQRSFHQRFHHVFAYKLSPDVNLQRLREAWKVLVAYHPILRSTFASAPGCADPRVVTFAPDSREADLTEECIGHNQELLALAEKMKTIIMSPLPLSSMQTKGLVLTSTSTNNRYLLIRMHHFQYDAHSLRLLLEDLSSLYAGPSPQNTSDASAFLAAFTPSPANLSEQRLYWQSIMPVPFLPGHLPPLVSETKGSPFPKRILVTTTPAMLGVTELREKAQAVDLPLHYVLLASWASVQASYSSSNHATFGLWHVGRTGSAPNVVNLAVPCMNVLPVHVPVSDDLLDVARKMQQDLRKRTPVVQQSSLLNIDEWITGGQGLPLTNVSINLLVIAQEDARENELFTFVEVDHFIPTVPLVIVESDVIDTLPITRLLQDDVMVDIVINERLDTVTMSIESERTIMDTVCAEEIIDAWATGVKRCLSQSI